ncbi:MAG: alpha/beta hydrolase, partial [Casimicrobiaceae bacterium]
MQDSPRRGPVDPQVAAVLEKIRLAGKPEYWQMTPAQAREWHNRKAGILDIAPEAVHAVEDRVVRAIEADVPVRIYTPRASPSPLPILVWLHGGGHVVGSLQSYDALCRKLSL